ncbi:MAG: hypothetical protein GWO85_01580 [Simkaniaceae bacterium]|nr:hypothetical protein [Simkaniaceae bacterium]
MVLPLIKSFHILVIATWVGLVVTLEFIWKHPDYLKEKPIQQLSLFLVKRLEFIVGLLVLISGLLMIVYDPTFFKMGWLHVKLTIWVIVFGMGHLVRSRLEKIQQGADHAKSLLNLNRTVLFGLILAVFIVELKLF